MFKTQNTLFNIAIACIMVSAPAALAADGTTPGGAPGEGRFSVSKRLAEGGGPGGRAKMDFSDEQLQKMGALNNKFKDSIGAQAVQLGSLHRQLKEVFTQPQVDRAKALDIQSKINAIKADLSIAKLNHKLDKMAILTPEQREKMRHRMLVSEAFGGGRGGHFGRGHGGKRFHHGGGQFRGMKRGPGAAGGPGAGAMTLPAPTVSSEKPTVES